MKAFVTRYLCAQNAATIVAAFCLMPSAGLAQSAGTTQIPPVQPLSQPPPQPSAASIFITIGERPAILFDAPSAKSNRIFILPRFQPVEVLVKLDKWVKIRDAEGTLGWIENALIGDRRFVLVSSASAEIRSAASSAAPLVFEAQKNVLLELTGAPAEGWVPVRHRDGQAGFVRAAQVWGS